MAEPTWQETLRLRLVERNARESSYAPIIEQCTCIRYAPHPRLPTRPPSSSLGGGGAVRECMS